MDSQLFAGTCVICYATSWLHIPSGTHMLIDFENQQLTQGIRSKFYVLSSPICVQVSQLFRSSQKHLVLGKLVILPYFASPDIFLAALRFFKATMNKKDDFYNRYLVKNDLFLPILQTLQRQDGKDNLLSSACLEFLEQIRANNVKAVLNHLMDKHGDLMRLLAVKNHNMALVILKWEQNNEPPPAQAAPSNEVYVFLPVNTRLSLTLPTGNRNSESGCRLEPQRRKKRATSTIRRRMRTKLRPRRGQQRSGKLTAHLRRRK